MIWTVLWLACHPNAPAPPIHEPPTPVVTGLGSVAAQPETTPFPSGSLYRQQHAQDAVQWRSWSLDSLKEASETDRPILLVIGDFSCENCSSLHRQLNAPPLAQSLNAGAIPILVDRVEHPVLTTLYASAHHRLSSHDSLPLALWLTPSGRPFATLSLVESERSQTVLAPATVFAQWAHPQSRQPLLNKAVQLDVLINKAAKTSTAHAPTIQMQQRSVMSIVDDWNSESNSWKTAAPHHHAARLRLLVLWIAQHPEDTQTTAVLDAALTALSQGPMHDHVAGGFYLQQDAQDDTPAFSKSLAVNAQLAEVYALAATQLDAPHFANIAVRTIDWIRREMRDRDGSFYESQGIHPIDSPHHQWTADEIEQIVENPEDFHSVFALHPVHRVPVQQGDTIDLLAQLALTKLRLSRTNRPSPHSNTRRSTADNALLVSAMATTGHTLQRSTDVTAAEKLADIIKQRMASHGYLPQYLGATAPPMGTLMDHALTAAAFLQLHRATGQMHWLAAADDVAQRMLNEFVDGERIQQSHTEALFAHPLSHTDGRLPSATGTAVAVLAQMHALQTPAGHHDTAATMLAIADRTLQRSPASAPTLAMATRLLLAPHIHVLQNDRSTAPVTPEPFPFLPWLHHTIIDGGSQTPNSLSMPSVTQFSQQNAQNAVCIDGQCRFISEAEGDIQNMIDQAMSDSLSP